MVFGSQNNLNPGHGVASNYGSQQWHTHLPRHEVFTMKRGILFLQLRIPTIQRLFTDFQIGETIFLSLRSLLG